MTNVDLNTSWMKTSGKDNVVDSDDLERWKSDLNTLEFDTDLVDAVILELETMMAENPDLTFEDAAELLELYLDADGQNGVNADDAKALENMEDTNGDGFVTANEEGDKLSPASDGVDFSKDLEKMYPMYMLDSVLGMDDTTYQDTGKNELLNSLSTILGDDSEEFEIIEDFITKPATLEAVKKLLESIKTLGYEDKDDIFGSVDFKVLSENDFTIEPDGTLSFTDGQPEKPVREES